MASNRGRGAALVGVDMTTSCSRRARTTSLPPANDGYHRQSRTPNAAELCCFRCYSTSCVATSTTGGALSRPNKYPQSWKWDTRSKWLPNLRSHSKRRPRCFVQYRVSVEWSGADFQDVLSAWRVRIPERSAALAAAANCDRRSGGRPVAVRGTRSLLPSGWCDSNFHYIRRFRYARSVGFVTLGRDAVPRSLERAPGPGTRPS